MSRQNLDLEEALGIVEDGKQGKNIGLPFSLPKLNDYMGGIHRGDYFLIGGDTGSGKSYFVSQVFVIDAVRSALRAKKPIEIISFTPELKASRQILRAVPSMLYNKYKIVASYSDITSRKEIMSDDLYNKVMELKPVLASLFSHVHFYDNKISSSVVEEVLGRHANRLGKFSTGERRKRFTPDKEDQYVIAIFDHGDLAVKESGQDDKSKVDDVSTVMREYRNMCGFTCVMVSQYNRGIQDYKRQQSSYCEPTLADFKGTANTQQDAEFVMALHDPSRYAQTDYRGHKTRYLGNKIRGIHILKGRDEAGGKVIPLCYRGELGKFVELPHKSKLPTEEHKLRELYESFLK